MTSLAEPRSRFAVGAPAATPAEAMTSTGVRPLRQIGARVRPAPALEPPFDDEGADWPPLRLLPGGSEQLPFDDEPAPPQAGGSVPPAPPDPHRWAAQFVRAVLEVRAARRPLQQLMPWTTTSVYSGLSHDLPLRKPAAAAIVRSVHVRRPSETVAEVCAVVTAAGRARAVAARLAHTDGRWRCTALHIG